jgi:hypothetical protein
MTYKSVVVFHSAVPVYVSPVDQTGQITNFDGAGEDAAMQPLHGVAVPDHRAEPHHPRRRVAELYL